VSIDLRSGPEEIPRACRLNRPSSLFRLCFSYLPQVPTPLISRCVCRHFPFAELLPLARERHWELEGIMRETGCGAQCGLCRPYLRRMLATGETEFHEVIWE